MAAILKRLKYVPNHLPVGTYGVTKSPRNTKDALVGVMVDKGERYGGAALFGFLKGYYAERFIWKGHGADLWLGAGLTLGSAVAAAIGFDGAAKHLERLGDSGMMSAINALAASYGLKKGGHSVAFASANKPAALPGKKTGVAGDVLGAIPPAVGGRTLDANEIINWAQRR